jgi:hypothetical protein
VLLSRVVEALDDRDRAAVLRAELLPWADGMAVQAFGNVVYGPVARHLGILDTVLGDIDGAIAWYARARQVAGRWSPNHWAISALGGGRLLVDPRRSPEDQAEGQRLVREARAIFEQLGMPGYAAEAAAALAASDAGEATGRGLVGADAASTECAPSWLRREGATWSVRFRGGPLLAVGAMKGLPALAELVARPHRELHVLELAAAIEGTPVAIPAGNDPLLDASARRAYEDRIVALRTALDDADATGDAHASDEAQAELDALVVELERATGLGGRDRRPIGDTERARVNVTKLLRRTVDRLGELDAGLGAHLRASLRTGTWCSYSPDPAADITWEP